MPIKPSILVNVENILGKNKIEKYIEEIKDNLYIEDLSGRLIIHGNYSQFKIEEFISGIPISIKGRLNHDNIFLFDDFLFYKNNKDNNSDKEINSQNDNNKDENSIHDILSEKILLFGNGDENNENKNLILFISNLKLGKLSEYEEGLKPSIRGLLIDFIHNKNNINNTLYQYSKRISRIILVGSSLNTFEKEIEKKIIFTRSSPSLNDFNKSILENYSLFNKFLNIISNYVYTDVMSSIDMVDDLKYPQCPLNKLLFSENIQNINLSSLKLVSNPYFFNIFVPSLNKEKYFIGSSGENINIIRQYSCYENTIDIMKKNLEWKHLCPINPSYSYLYSLDNIEDPLVLNRIPDVYFTSGNKDLKYENVEIDNKNVLLISLPDFEKTSKCVLYNYEDDSLMQIDFSFDF